jgi:CIC family chloride channel protein
VGALVFRRLIALVHNLVFLGQLSWAYDANQHTPASPWGAWIIAGPVLAAVVVAWLIERFAPEARGHGVPEVMDAVYYEEGRIRPRVAVVKSLASALSIGSGGAVGREGPIVQIAASVGSGIGQILRIPVWQRVTLIAAGAGAGIAATFNTPIGGVLFAVEIVLHEISVRTLVPVVIATATAAYCGQYFFGANPSFVIPALEVTELHLVNPLVLVAFLALGGITGLASVAYIRSLDWAETFFERLVPRSYVLRHALGMLGVGVTMYVCLRAFGHYYVEGVGYSLVQDVLSGSLQVWWLLLLLAVLKLAVTITTLGSGASGGIFSPALFMGAALGGAYGVLLERLAPGLGVHPPALAVAGMAGMVGGTIGAAMTAVVMIFEMTLDYNVIIPMTIMVATSYGVRRLLCRESIYTAKLARRGHPIPEALHANVHLMRLAREVMEESFPVLEAEATLEEAAEALAATGERGFLVVAGGGRVREVASADAVLRAVTSEGRGASLAGLTGTRFVVADGGETLFELASRMRRRGAPVVVVTEGEGEGGQRPVAGLVTRDRIAEVVAGSIDLFSG